MSPLFHIPGSAPAAGSDALVEMPKLHNIKLLYTLYETFFVLLHVNSKSG